MASGQELQALLRFLTQDARVPLATAMSKVKQLREAGLKATSEIAAADIDTLKSIFEDEKVAKQILGAAKRVSKRKADGGEDPSPKKRTKTSPTRDGTEKTPAQVEASLALPTLETDEDKIKNTVLISNRAPLVLAFAVTLLKYTMPHQPLSSRLSLAQTVVSVNSRSKAVSLGIESGKSAEEEGFGEGQPLIKVMGREIRVLKRYGYNPLEGAGEGSQESDPSTQEEIPLWGLDLGAIKGTNDRFRTESSNTLPIHTPQSARSYLLRAFAAAETKDEEKSQRGKPKGKTGISKREQNVGYLLGAIDLLFQSWAPTLSQSDLDSRAWSWYVRVRPEVAQGVEGWGGKGQIRLAEILDLRRAT